MNMDKIYSKSLQVLERLGKFGKSFERRSGDSLDYNYKNTWVSIKKPAKEKKRRCTIIPAREQPQQQSTNNNNLILLACYID